MAGQLSDTTRVFVIDDHNFARTYTCQLLVAAHDLDVCGATRTPEEALPFLAAAAPTVVVVELEFLYEPRSRNGFEAVAAFRALVPAARFAITASRCSAEILARARESGVLGYLVKGRSTGEQLLAMIRAVAAGRTCFGREAHDLGIPVQLTPTEARLAQVLQRHPGMTNEELARRMGSGPEAVKSHLQHMTSKTATNGKAELSVWLREHLVADRLPG